MLMDPFSGKKIYNTSHEDLPNTPLSSQGNVKRKRKFVKRKKIPTLINTTTSFSFQLEKLPETIEKVSTTEVEKSENCEIKWVKKTKKPLS